MKGSVVNSAATVKLSSAVSIEGNYSQTGGGLLIATSNSGTSYGYLTVSGAATVTNTAVTISGSGLTSGETFTIVRPSGTGSYTNDTATVSGTSGLSAALSTSGDDLIVTLSAATAAYQSTGLTNSASAGGVGAALDALASSSISSGMQSILTHDRQPSSTAAKAQAIKELAPSSDHAPALMGLRRRQSLTSNAVDIISRRPWPMTPPPARPPVPRPTGAPCGDRSWAAGPCAAEPPMPTATG